MANKNKDVSVVWANVTQAAAATTTSASVDLTRYDGVAWFMKNLNHTTGPTVENTIIIEVSPDDSEFYELKTPELADVIINGGTSLSVTTSKAGYLPEGTKFVRFKSTGNTDQQVFIDAHIVGTLLRGVVKEGKI